MNNGFAIEHLVGRDITAKILDDGALYSTYKEFAISAGYSDAVANFLGSTEDHRKSAKAELLVGKTVTVLAKGKHGEGYGTLYVVESEDGERFIFGESGIEILEENEMVTKIEARYEKAVEQAREAVEELRLAALAKGYEDAKRELQAVAPTTTTAQAQRDAIVEQAKRDVAELKSGYNNAFYRVRGIFGCNAKFIVNAEKRTVVVLLLGVGSGKVRAKGIAKCAPIECFNAHIGRAIALRRALGLEVPAEYTNAPQPTEVRVGDVIKVDITGYIAYVDKVSEDWAFGKYADGDEFYAPNDQFKIIDDTRESTDI